MQVCAPALILTIVRYIYNDLGLSVSRDLGKEDLRLTELR